MNVFVLNYDGKPLMPTKRGGRVRKLLDSGDAVVVKRIPFTIRLTREKKRYIQEISLGVKSGSKRMEMSASTEKEELFSAEATLRTDIVNLLSTRKEQRRSRLLRHRKPRFNNRGNSKQKGRLMPSIENKIQFHLKMIDLVHQLLPICYIYVEIGYFNIQKIQNPEISGKEYQEGPQKGFWNVREYVLFRDNHTCQYCKGKSGDNILRVHHIESRKTGGNSPSNLITLCKTCHDKHHKGEINLRIKRGKSFKDESYMNIMKNTLMERIAKKYKTNEIIFPTFSYQTKYVRSQENLPRNIYSDSFVISGNYLAKQCDIKYICKQIRRHNRQIHRAKFSKDGVRKNTQVSYLTFGFRLHDIVRYNGDLYRIISRRITGGFDIIRLSDGYSRKISYKKLKFVSISNRLVIYSNKF